MLSNDEQETIDAFVELRSIGQELADRISEWNEDNIDEANSLIPITSEMSGDAVVLNYTEHAIGEDIVIKMLSDIGFSPVEESDDTLEADVKKSNDVAEWLNEFIYRCIEVSQSYPNLVKAIALQPGNNQRKDEVRIVIPTDVDLRKLSCKDARKIMFMHFLKDIRAHAAKYSMLDEAFCFNAMNKDFTMILRPLSRAKLSEE